MANSYEDGYLTAGVNALAALGNRVGLYDDEGDRVGTAYADTTWGTAALSGSVGSRKAIRTGSKVTVSVPASTVANGTTITHYGIHNGSTLLRKVGLTPISVIVNDGSQAFTIDVTPVIDFNPTE